MTEEANTRHPNKEKTRQTDRHRAKKLERKQYHRWNAIFSVATYLAKLPPPWKKRLPAFFVFLRKSWHSQKTIFLEIRRRWHTWHKEEPKRHICTDTITLDAASICMSVHSWNSSIGQWSQNSRKRNTLKTREQPGVTHRVGRNVHRLKKCHEADTTKNERNYADERRTRHADRKKKVETAVNREEQIQQQFTLTLSEYLLSCALESFSIREKTEGKHK